MGESSYLKAPYPKTKNQAAFTSFLSATKSDKKYCTKHPSTCHYFFYFVLFTKRQNKNSTGSY